MMSSQRLCEQHDRSAKIELGVDGKSDSVVVGHFAPTRPEDVYGCLKHDGPPITVAAMDEAVQREARKHQ
jgi:hypothetical protein